MADTIHVTPVKLDFCTQLRTKRSYISDDPPATYLTEDVSETGYWCVRTMAQMMIMFAQAIVARIAPVTSRVWPALFDFIRIFNGGGVVFKKRKTCPSAFFCSG